MSLNEYLREKAGLKGTKVMCREAGCGCCAVTVSHLPTDSNTVKTYSVQSCLTPLYAVDGWQISTVEGIGSQRDGFHPIQERIAKFNGTQCGYCTPGMVMNMYGLLHQKPNITAQEVEDNFDGNICRCTGYRPILDAMKSFSEDANIPGRKAIDIEDLNKNLCPKTGETCSGNCGSRSLDLEISGARWYRPLTLADLGKVMKANKDKKTRLFFGNTSTGIYKNDGPFDVYVDLHRVKELFSFQATDTNVRLGAATTLTQFLEKLRGHQEKPGFKCFSQVHKHLKVVANVMVRNAGSIGGNLMIKHNHKDFPSDIFTTLEAAGAQVEIFDTASSAKKTVPLLEFMTSVNMSGKVLTAVILPRLADNVVYRTFKITPRWQNAHAYVNAAFKIPFADMTVKGQPSIVLGGISADTIHAKKTETFLANKKLSAAVVKEAYSTLRDELVPTESPLESSAKYRKELASGLLYKVLLGLCGTKNPKVRTGAEDLHRPVSSGLQTYQEMAREFPLKHALPKVTSTLQASGEAVFVNDMPKFQQELFAAFAIADVGSAIIGSIDPSEALKIPGVTHFLSAKDTLCNDFPQPMNPELFATKEVFYAGQPLGLVLAETQPLAIEAAKKVKVNYSKVMTPILTVEDSLARGKEFESKRKTTVIGNPDDAWKSVDHTVEGTVSMGSQYHFYMETQVTLAVPSEDGIDLYASTQNSDLCQFAASRVIDKPMHFINITVPRVGGGFGGKSLDTSTLAAAASLGAYKTKRPVRLSLDLSSNMRMLGKRPPYKATYKAGFTKEGDVQVIEVDYMVDVGFTEDGSFFTTYSMGYLDMCYHVPNWKIVGKSMMTNKRTMVAVRAPGSVPAALISESIFEHVAQALGKHSTVVKELNLYSEKQTDLTGHVLNNCTVRELWRRLKDVAEVDARIRQINAFNQENQWKKRGITMTTCKYGMCYFGAGHGATVTIFARDGSVQISQGGVEMGQGLYTKVAQGVAHILGVPLDNIKVRPNQGVISPNSVVSGGSVASESSMQAAIGAAEILRERMKPIKEKFPDADWKTLCEKSNASKIDLTARFLNEHRMGSPYINYHTYCVAVTETEVDVLTGESQIRRVDIMADYGESLNPMIDIGQTEGGFVMGLGNFASEDTIFDSKTGQILNDGTWNYKPPTTKDIPIDWRIHLLPDTPNPSGIRSSKATGEPSIALSVGGLLANKQALQSARKDLFGKEDFIPVVAPFTVERAQQSVGLNESLLAV
ncbi:xanthine dehydrogenase/oxidase [Plakobranchus ocellatus]|uniref:Xanthine dehydrogenase/oxidase n=1 Tax=Plakobranchus ocellatus TaxID=259542 RepID=A0AAV4BW55_9GAST|nr:xanthine dehydrogenase/oxidase [Plakobranchus ocellatus]